MAQRQSFTFSLARSKTNASYSQGAFLCAAPHVQTNLEYPRAYRMSVSAARLDARRSLNGLHKTAEQHLFSTHPILPPRRLDL
jgi:hypothetical protein